VQQQPRATGDNSNGYSVARSDGVMARYYLHYRHRNQCGGGGAVGPAGAFHAAVAEIESDRPQGQDAGQRDRVLDGVCLACLAYPGEWIVLQGVRMRWLHT
jgi:hypothetical protein